MLVVGVEPSGAVVVPEVAKFGAPREVLDRHGNVDDAPVEVGVDGLQYLVGGGAADLPLVKQNEARVAEEAQLRFDLLRDDAGFEDRLDVADPRLVAQHERRAGRRTAKRPQFVGVAADVRGETRHIRRVRERELAPRQFPEEVLAAPVVGGGNYRERAGVVLEEGLLLRPAVRRGVDRRPPAFRIPCDVAVETPARLKRELRRKRGVRLHHPRLRDEREVDDVDLDRQRRPAGGKLAAIDAGGRFGLRLQAQHHDASLARPDRD